MMVESKVLFCNIAWMKYYRGAKKGDIPQNGGVPIAGNADAENFLPCGNRVYGFVETKHINRDINRPKLLHIEQITGDNKDKKADSVDDILVVWCATSPSGGTYVVGWYKNATVYRGRELAPRHHNVSCALDDATLLPESERANALWRVPRAKGKSGFGFGQANHWFAKKPVAQKFVESLLNNIDLYHSK